MSTNICSCQAEKEITSEAVIQFRPNAICLSFFDTRVKCVCDSDCSSDKNCGPQGRLIENESQRDKMLMAKCKNRWKATSAASLSVCALLKFAY